MVLWLQGLLTKMRRLAKAYESKLNFFYLKKVRQIGELSEHDWVDSYARSILCQGDFSEYEKKLKLDSKAYQGRPIVCMVTGEGMKPAVPDYYFGHRPRTLAKAFGAIGRPVAVSVYLSLSALE